MTLYNELEPFAAQWLSNLSTAGHIAPGVVDARSIQELTPADLVGHTQAHFFAGIGVWSHALRLAGWPDDVPVWTGSCPCQPFSAAGKKGGFDDERHLWPVWFNLIRQCRPPIIFGEQVASPDGLKWLDTVQADLEGEGYAFGAADLCAASVGAPHIRQRLYFVAVARGERLEGLRVHLQSGQPRAPGLEALGGGAARGVAYDDDDEGPQGRGGAGRDAYQRLPGADGVADFVGDAGLEGGGGHAGAIPRAEGEGEGGGSGAGHLANLAIAPGPVNGFWRDAEWIPCRDGKSRPVEPGTFPLVDGIANRVGTLRAYGNAIVPQVAATFIQAVMGYFHVP